MSKKKKYVEKIIQLIDDYILKSNNLKIIFSNGESKKTIYIVKDKIVDLDSSDVSEKYAALLMANKLVTREDFVVARAQAQKAREVDEYLIEKRNLTSDQIKMVFSLQLSKILHSLLNWNSINFKVTSFIPSNMPTRKRPLHIEELYLHLFRIAPPALSKEERKMILFSPLSLVTDKLSILKSLPLNQQEGHFLSKLNGVLTLSQIANYLNEPPIALEPIIFTFYRLGFVKPEETSEKHPQDLQQEFEDKKKKKENENSISVDEIVKEYSDFLEDISSKDYYEVLNIERKNFSISEAKANYYSLARKFHPDTYRKYGSDKLNEILENILNILNTAYDTLKDEKKRKKYDEELDTAYKKGSFPSTGNNYSQNINKIAISNFNRGRNLINAKKYAEAVVFLKRSVQIDPENGDYHAYLGYAMSKTSQFKRAAEKHFQKAIELNPMNISTYIHMGRMYKEARVYNKALHAFSEALKWDPENKIIHKEIEEINALTGKKSKGFFGNLFKK